MHVVAYLAHSDDEVLGCGGLLAKFAAQHHKITVVLASDGYMQRPDHFNNKNHAAEACKILGAQDLRFLDFHDQHFDNYPLIAFNQAFDKLQLDPDLIITHAPDDVNEDHKIICRSTLVISRPVGKQIKVLGCETLSATEWAEKTFSPNFYADITDYLDKKLEAMKAYSNELREFPHPRSLKGIQIKARQRGMEAGVQAAEAYRVLRWYD